VIKQCRKCTSSLQLHVEQKLFQSFSKCFCSNVCADAFVVACADDQPMFLPAVIEAKIQQILQPLAIPPRPVTPPLNVKPKLNFSTHPSAKQLSPDLAPGRPLTLACQRNYGSESNLLDSLSSAAADDRAGSADNRSLQCLLGFV